MRKQFLNTASILAVLGIAYSDELPLLVSLVGAAFLGIEAFVTASSGIDHKRSHKLFCWQLTELQVFAVITVLVAVAAVVTGPSLGILYSSCPILRL